MHDSPFQAMVYQDPQSMLSIARLDVYLKKLAMDVFAGKRVLQKNLILSLYRKHILIRTGGVEPYDPFNVSSWRAKNSVDDFVEQACALYVSMKQNGFDANFPISFSPQGRLGNAAHRLGAALSLGLPKVPVVHVPDGGIWDYAWFQKHVSHFERLFLLKEYALFKPNCAPVILWGPCEAHWEAIEAQLGHNFSVTRVDTVDFKNAHDGFLYFVQNLYGVTEFSEEIIRRKATLMASYSKRFRVLHVEDPVGAHQSDDFFARLRVAKDHIRQCFDGLPPRAVFWTLHTPDSVHEKAHMVENLYNRNRLRTYRLMSRWPMSHAYLSWLREGYDVCMRENIGVHDVCLTGSGAFALIGLRDATDIDFTVLPSARARYGDGSRSFSENVDLVTKGYHRSKRPQETWVTDEELINCPEYHFWYAGFKFCNPELVYARKNFSRRDKDVRDLGLMKEHLRRVCSPFSVLKLSELAHVELAIRMLA